MEVILDGEKLEAIAIKYNSDEFAAARFAVQLYRGQLEAGSVTVDEVTALQAVEIIDYVDSELAEGLDTISPKVDAIMNELFLPYVATMHGSLSSEHYQECCTLLQCAPVDLFTYGIEAIKMLEADRSKTSLVAFEPDSY